MTLSRFDNATGEGIIGFHRSQTSGPEYEANNDLWYAALTVNGKRVFHYACPCGTCGLTFKKVADAGDRVSDAEAAELLGNLDHVPSRDTLVRLARILPPGEYLPVIIEAPVRLVIPGARDDYFATEVVSRFGFGAPEYEAPEDPGTPYYRLGTDSELVVPFPSGEFQIGSGASKAEKFTRTLLTQIVMPLHNPTGLNRDRVSHWKTESRSGHPLTAFAVAVLDNQMPGALGVGDANYPFKRQMLLTHCLLDGHHRMQAAAETGSLIRILSFLAGFASNVSYKFDYEPIFERIGARV